ncbi:hypothetical protein AVEN_170796-1, partial [Araneus ventricosus]
SRKAQRSNKLSTRTLIPRVKYSECDSEVNHAFELTTFEDIEKHSVTFIIFASYALLNFSEN